MLRTLDRYVFREFMRLFLLFSLAAPLLFVLGDWTDNLDKFTSRQIPPLRVALSYVYQFPLFVLWSFPIAALIATVFTVSNMSRHSEMSAAKAGGISFWRAIVMLPLLGVLLTGAALGLSELVPITLALQKEVLGEKERAPGIRSNFVYRTETGDVFSVRQLDASRGRMINVVMEREHDGVPRLHVTAREAVWDSVGTWTLADGRYRTFSTEGSESLFAYQKLVLPRFRETPEQLLAEPKDPEEMRYAELDHFIEILQRSGTQPRKLMVERAQKIALPAATLIIILFGAPMANSQARGGPAYGIGVSLGITIAYLMMFRVSEAFGTAGTIPPFVAAWIPNGLFLLAALVLMLRVRT
jgi:lipopolysaccharide export system permease protein